LDEPAKVSKLNSSFNFKNAVSGLFSLIQKNSAPNLNPEKQVPQDIKLPDISISNQVKQMPNISLPVFESDLK
jgi:hypothetical protein